MKVIKIKSLKLTNFKGIRSLVIDDLQQETQIFGDNATGKTTVFDAFTWLLFGKDSSDRTNFEIKTLDANNNVIEKIDHEVEAEIDVDGEEIKIKRILREKWTKKKGSLEAEFTGNETQYEWNGVPMTQRDFQSKIGQIVDEKIFKLITSPAAFNSLKWQDQRAVLIEICGGVSDQDVASGNEDFESLLKNLTNKTIEEYQKQIKASISKSKKELKTIPTRIDEVDRSKPDTANFEQIKSDIEIKNKAVESLNDQISNKLEAQQEFINKRTKLQNEIHKVDTEINDVKHKLKKEAKDKFVNSHSEIDTIQSKINHLTSEISSNQKGLKTLESKLESKKNELSAAVKSISEVRDKWIEVNAEEFKMDEGDCKCPTCDREFDPETIDEKKAQAKERFETNKQKKLQQIDENGNSWQTTKINIGNEIDELEARIREGKKFIIKQETERDELLPKVEKLESEQPDTTIESIYQELGDSSSEIKSKTKKLLELKKELEDMKPVDVSELKTQRDQVESEISELKKQLVAEDQIKKADKRIEELKKEESELSQTIADYEREQFVIENFIKAKIDRLEASINDRFEFVNFKLFETQVNGGQVETCKALIDGVPFSDANTASKINAGIDIINTLCNHYQVSAPIFIDNRESVINLIDSQSQIVNLIVSKEDKQLRIA